MTTLWDPSQPSILQHVRRHLTTDGQARPAPEAVQLPDEDQRVAPGRDENDHEIDIGWAPGASDGVRTHHFGADEPEDAAKAALAAMRRAIEESTAAGGHETLYELARVHQAVDLADPLLQLVCAAGMTTEAIQPVARWLVTESRHREPLKLGIALLGLGHTDEDRKVLRLLARHDELTLFVAVALGGCSDHAEQELYELARSVTGWGRIHLVERLRDTTDPEIRGWILREGFRNDVMDEYLAYVAATTGDLVGHLRDDPSDDVLDAACGIVSALIMGGPAEDIDDYADAPLALELLLDHLAERSSRLHHLLVADTIGHFVDPPEGAPDARLLGADLAAELASSPDPWEERIESGWTSEGRERLRRKVHTVKALLLWDRLVPETLSSGDEREFELAAEAGRALGQDTFPACWNRLLADRDPVGSSCWYWVLRLADTARIGDVLDLAQRSLPLGEIASGPATAVGIGPGWEPHMTLDLVLQELRRFPGHGWTFVRTGLSSPAIRNRNLAIFALDAWGRDHWPTEAVETLAHAASIEPDAAVRSRFDRLLRGERVED